MSSKECIMSKSQKTQNIHKKNRIKIGIIIFSIIVILITGTFIKISTSSANNQYDMTQWIYISSNGGTQVNGQFIAWFYKNDREYPGYSGANEWHNDGGGVGKGNNWYDRDWNDHWIIDYGDHEDTVWNKWFRQHTDCVGITPYVCLPEMTRTGYTFTGWSNDHGREMVAGPDAAHPYAMEAGCFDSNGNLWPEQSIVINANYRPNNYTINFDGNGGTVKENSVTTTYDSSNYWSREEYAPSREGYIFEGWYDANGKQVYDANCKANNSTGYWSENIWRYPDNVTVYAHWKAQYILDVNATVDGVKTDSSLPVTFDVYIDNIQVSDDADDWYQYVNPGSTVVVKDIKAKSGYTYTGQSSYSYYMDKNQECVLPISHIMNKVVYVRYQDSNGNWSGYQNKGTISKVYGQIGSYSEESDVRYYGVSWSGALTSNDAIYLSNYRKQYTLTYDGNGGSPGVPTLTRYYEQTWGALANAGRRAYTFNGWYTDPVGGSQITSSTINYGNTTAYAHWNAINVSYNLSDVYVYQGEEFGYDDLLKTIKDVNNYFGPNTTPEYSYGGSGTNTYGAQISINGSTYTNADNDDTISSLSDLRNKTTIGQVNGQDYVGTYELKCRLFNNNGSYTDKVSTIYIMKVDPYITASSAEYYENQFYTHPFDATNSYLIPTSVILRDASAYAYSCNSSIEPRIPWDNVLTSQVKVTRIQYHSEKWTVKEDKTAVNEGVAEIITVNNPTVFDTHYIGTHDVTIQVTNEYGNVSEYNFTVKVKYNNIPEIVSTEKYFFVGDIINRTALLDDETCNALDIEDGNIKNSTILTNEENCSIVTELQGIDSSTARTLTVNVDVTDAFGKKDHKTIKVTIIKTEPDTSYVRSISKEYIDTLDQKSVWNTDIYMKQLLSTTLKKKPAQEYKDDNDPYKDSQSIYEFTAEQLKELAAQNYELKKDGLHEMKNKFSENRLK